MTKDYRQFFLCMLLLSGFYHSLHAQTGKKKLYGVGVSYGFTNYLGDLDDNFTFRFTQYGVGAHLQYALIDRVHIRGTLYYGYMEASI
jgi:hypothetical protein